ncbi:hypothetical protein VTO42DRAFT_868 [Malbranchea cinnamomea]
MSYVTGSSRRNHFVEPPSLTRRLVALLPSGPRTLLSAAQSRIAASIDAICAAYNRERRNGRRFGVLLALLRLVFTIPNLLLLLWVGTLWWGERSAFRDSVRECRWESWESWPQNSVPSHVVLIADPQLVDAHTYPGRPWPLSSLTVFYADLYLYRAYTLLQKYLRPDATLFLGDLFDGGREWATESSTSPDERYKKYGNDVWMKEYRRFARIFFDTFKLGGEGSHASPRGRKLIAGLPGNHDLGFGSGIQLPVLKRFRTFFGDGNRVDIIGNHTFVSVDSVSLSAMDQTGPSTGDSDSAGSGETNLEEIWRPTADFLDRTQTLKAKAIQEELLLLRGEAEAYSSPHTVTDAVHPSKPTLSPAPSDADFPTIVLTHVPFYREAGTPCGPLREHYPPSSTDPLPEKDERNSIKIHRGYQYQNVLTAMISNEIATKAGPLTQIYSGDDHDYCEIIHQDLSGQPREITVKSMSLAMSVRRPGFQMVSLWNPVDPTTGKSTKSASSTIQNHLCLLPDQISIFVQYAYIFVFTVLVLAVRALSLAFRVPITTTYEPILPVSNPHPDGNSSFFAGPSAATSSSSHNNGLFGSRGSNMTPRTGSSTPLNDTSKPVKHVRIVGASGLDNSDDDYRLNDIDPFGKVRRNVSFDRAVPIRGIRRRILIFRTEFFSPFKRIAIWALVWYLWLIWTW